MTANEQPLASIEEALERGRVEVAAEQARLLAGVLSESQLRQLVRMLAGAMLAPVPRKHGRPPESDRAGGFERLVEQLAIYEEICKHPKRKGKIDLAFELVGRKHNISKTEAKTIYYNWLKSDSK